VDISEPVVELAAAVPSGTLKAVKRDDLDGPSTNKFAEALTKGLRPLDFSPSC
jgi:hypothetical protein